MLIFKNILLSKYFPFLALGLHLFILFVLFSNFGFNFSHEADKYLFTAEKLDFNNFNDVLQYQWLSSTYILFLALCLKMGLSLTTIIVVQFVFSLTGYYFFYKFLVSQSFFSKVHSRICMLLIMCSPIILYWQLTLFSESFFIALSMIATYFAFNSATLKNLILTLIFSLLLIFCRPVGVFYALGLLFVVMKLRQIKSAFVLVSVSYAVLILIILFVAPLHFKGIALPVLEGSVICGHPTYPDLSIAEGNYTLFGVYSILIEQHGFASLCELFFQKGISFFTLTRPYYSTSHNIVNAMHYVFLFVALYSVYDLKRKKIHPLLTSYSAMLIVSSALLVVLFYNEWSERYIVPLFPFFILLFVLFISKIQKPFAV
jgi:hypothetical protein